MLDVFAGFVHELRGAGIPVSLTEDIDAMAALRHVPLDDRETVKHTLAATLVKSSAHRPTFETLFEVYFGARPAPDPEAGGGAVGAPWALSAEDLGAVLEAALVDGDDAAVDALAREAVSRYAGMGEGRPVGPRYYLFRTLRHLDVDGLPDRLLARALASRGEVTALEERLLSDEHRARLERLRSEVEAEVRRRLVTDRGPQTLARTLRGPLPEDVDFMHASADELAALARALQPLARKLGARLAHRRRHRRRGPLDFRSTVRHSLSYGGVPAEPRFRHPRPSKPEIVVMADVSGSVAAFSRFTLQLVHAISSQFSRVRSFAFVDGIDEVTPFFEASEDFPEAMRRVSTEADVVQADGHSDYGAVLEGFWERWGDEVSPRASVIVLGDARNNYHASASWVVRELSQRARHVYWLNPEPRSYWDTGDSVHSEYAVHCDGAFECRNLRQLQGFVEQLA